MRLVSRLALAGFALGVLSTSASAAVVLVATPGVVTNPAHLVWDFNATENSNFSYVGDVFAGSINNIAADPGGATGFFGAAEPSSAVSAVQAATSPSNSFTDATFSLVNPSFKFSELSLNLGSLDTFNTLTLYTNDNTYTFSGTTLAALLPGFANGDQFGPDANGRFTFVFSGGEEFNKLVFSSGNPAFEFSDISAAVPEPATWAMMILGFGFVGFMMRSNRQKVAPVAA